MLLEGFLQIGLSLLEQSAPHAVVGAAEIFVFYGPRIDLTDRLSGSRLNRGLESFMLNWYKLS